MDFDAWWEMDGEGTAAGDPVAKAVARSAWQHAHRLGVEAGAAAERERIEAVFLALCGDYDTHPPRYDRDFREAVVAAIRSAPPLHAAPVADPDPRE